MPININPEYIAGAVLFPNPNYSLPCLIEGDNVKPQLRMTPLQFTFENTFCWFVDLRNGNPNPPLDRISALYIDTGLSFNDAYIYVPDSGFSAIINAGAAQMLPIFSGLKIPPFYLILSPDEVTLPDDREPSADLINILAFNKNFMPPFNTGAAIRTLDYKYGDGFAPTPNFVMDDIFTSSTTITSPAGNTTIDLITNTRWFVKGVDISVTGLTTAAGATAYTAQLLDGTVPILTKNFVMQTTETFQQIFDLQELNYASLRAGGGNLNLVITTHTNLTAIVSANIYGGVLVP